MLCQSCGALNKAEQEHCFRCRGKLMVVSGLLDLPAAFDDDLELEEVASDLDEHLLERISGLEELAGQLSRALAGLLERLAGLEHEQTVTHTGVEVLIELLEAHGVLSQAEIHATWERSLGQELVSRSLARRFSERAERILSQAEHTGESSAEFRRLMRVLELALAGSQGELVHQHLATMARLAPSNDELWSFIGEAAFETGDLDTARVAFSRVLDLRGDHFETLIYLGTVLSDLGEVDAAERSLEAALSLDPDSFLAHFTLGALELVRGDYKAAARYLERASALDPVPQALYLLGLCHLRLGRPGRAAAVLERAVEMQPDFEEALYQLGLAYLRRGWSRRALATFEQVLELDPQRLQYQETVRMLRLDRPEDLSPEASRLLASAESRLEAGRAEAALELLGAAGAVAPDQPYLAAEAALLASALGRPREALSHAHRLLRLEPLAPSYQAAAAVALLEALRRAERPHSARRLAAAMMERVTDPLTRGLIAYELALVELALGEDLDRARQLAREALEAAPKELRCYPLGALGEIALKAGNTRKAVQYLEQAVDAGAATPSVARQLAMARLAAGDPDGAEAALDAAEEDGGLDHDLLGHVRRLGSLLEGLGGSVRHPRNPR